MGLLRTPNWLKAPLPLRAVRSQDDTTAWLMKRLSSLGTWVSTDTLLAAVSLQNDVSSPKNGMEAP